ncbi:MAG: hypothetical protein L6U61_10650 [Bacteroidales bacterium]|nr:MAG: hypothetical protein L6U61_10650 [Bacteroidales bacterium]
MMLGDTNNRFSASRAVVVLASGLLVGLFLVALLSQMLARIDALDALTQMRLATTLQNLIMFMLPAVAVGTLCGGGTPLRFLRLDKAPSAMAVAGIVLISLAMTPAMNWLVAWNASLSLPEAMKPVEQWMRAQENAAQEATDMLLSGSSVWDLIASVVCVGLLTGLGEEMFPRRAAAHLLRRHAAPTLGGVDCRFRVQHAPLPVFRLCATSCAGCFLRLRLSVERFAVGACHRPCAQQFRCRGVYVDGQQLNRRSRNGRGWKPVGSCGYCQCGGHRGDDGCLQKNIGEWKKDALRTIRSNRLCPATPKC